MSLLFINPTDPYHWMSIQSEVIETIDEGDPERGATVTSSLNDMSCAYLGQATYPMRDSAGGDVRSLYRIRPNRVQVFGSAANIIDGPPTTPDEKGSR